MNTYTLFHAYLESLSLALPEHKRSDTFQDLYDFLSGVLACSEFQNVLVAQRISFQQKRDVFFSFLKVLKSKELKNFFELFLSEDRFYLFNQLHRFVGTYMRCFQSEVQAVLESPIELSSKDILKLQASFEDILKQKIAFKIEKNTSLLGGFRVTIGHKVYDASLSNSLDQFSSSLLDMNFMIGEKV